MVPENCAPWFPNFVHHGSRKSCTPNCQKLCIVASRLQERYQITTHKESGIQNDPNDWAKEVGNPRYILDLLLSVINVSVQTVEIVESLPKVKFE